MKNEIQDFIKRRDKLSLRNDSLTEYNGQKYREAGTISRPYIITLFTLFFFCFFTDEQTQNERNHKVYSECVPKRCW